MRKDFDQLLTRNTMIASDEVESATLLHIESIEEIAPENVIPLEEWDLPKDYLKYMSKTVEDFKVYWEKRKSVNDDLLPYLRPYYGIAEHSAFVGGEVKYGGNTSYHEHPLTDWALLDELKCDENNENFRMLLESMSYLKERSKSEGFIAGLRGVEAPLDIANAIRGNDLLMDFYLYPENVHKLCEFCMHAGKWTLQHQMDIIEQQYGGFMSAFGVWLPGYSIGQVSEDTTSLCSVDTYKEFGLPYTKGLLEDYDCAMFHIHTLGKHVLPEIAALEKAKFIQIEMDPNQLSPIEVYRENIDILKDKIIALNTTSAEIKENMDFLNKYKNILRIKCTTLQEAEDISNFVKTYSN